MKITVQRVPILGCHISEDYRGGVNVEMVYSLQIFTLVGQGTRRAAKRVSRFEFRRGARDLFLSLVIDSKMKAWDHEVQIHGTVGSQQPAANVAKRI